MSKTTVLIDLPFPKLTVPNNLISKQIVYAMTNVEFTKFNLVITTFFSNLLVQL